jgi:hypothetical protein
MDMFCPLYFGTGYFCKSLIYCKFIFDIVFLSLSIAMIWVIGEVKKDVKKLYVFNIIEQIFSLEKKKWHLVCFVLDHMYDY